MDEAAGPHGAEGDEDRARAAVPLHRGCALCAAVGGGAGEGNVLVRSRGQPKLKGKTVLLVDVSGCMDEPLSRSRR